MREHLGSMCSTEVAAPAVATPLLADWSSQCGKCAQNNLAPQGAKLEERRHGLEQWLKGALNHPNGRGRQRSFSSSSHDVVLFS